VSQLSNEAMFRYWGKAGKNEAREVIWHPLAYHSMDVAAVAACWWDASRAMRARFALAFGTDDAAALRAWVLYFVALHDLGKFDIRFQLRAPEALTAAGRVIEKGRDHAISEGDIRYFNHGLAGMAWGYCELPDWCNMDAESMREHWRNWLAAVTGHHGDYYPPRWDELKAIEADDDLIEHDRAARRAWVLALEDLLLRPAGLTLHHMPPTCSDAARALLAGFCAVCDWIGSNTDEFEYRAPSDALQDYFEQRQREIRERELLPRFGLVHPAAPYAGLAALLKPDENPRGVQTEIDALSAAPGLTLIEAPTGSGKTEAALAYAWRLLEAGAADSIVFALPTQATANAMLARPSKEKPSRIEAFAERAFGHANVVLAHGKRQFSDAFKALVERGQHSTAQGREEASVQCAAWLANSRKLVFLGQIGVCTVDQTLLSVLPVRHKFMRGFGINKSVLIVDEVHAYDAYMHGLLGEVLKNQKACGGSAILLSATLPSGLREKLLAAWDAHGTADAPYPALWWATGGEVIPRTVTEAHRPPRREVGVECLLLPDAYPDDALKARIVAAAEAGALVGFVANVVDVAQRLARELRELTTLDVDIFHARYRFRDRQEKEQAVLEHYGRAAPRGRGRILVATQVIEQSLDLDFDWLLTQICPVDLLFQRIGRLHRHTRESRPQGFETPQCSVLSVTGDDYGVFKLIYGNARVLWRTQRLLEQSGGRLVFPEAYREWIERVYDSDVWDEEPGDVVGGYMSWKQEQARRDADARQLTTMTVASFRDDDDRITGLTRDGEMSLAVLPLTTEGCLLEGERVDVIAERDLAEAINLDTVPVPASWKDSLLECRRENEGPLAGVYQLVLEACSGALRTAANGNFVYSYEFGLEKTQARKPLPE